MLSVSPFFYILSLSLYTNQRPWLCCEYVRYIELSRRIWIVCTLHYTCWTAMHSLCELIIMWCIYKSQLAICYCVWVRQKWWIKYLGFFSWEFFLYCHLNFVFSMFLSEICILVCCVQFNCYRKSYRNELSLFIWK